MNLLSSIGLGLDIAGGYMIAIGLLGHPKTVAFRAASFTGGSPHVAAAVVESYADAKLGIPIFLLGIIGQLIGGAVNVQACTWVGMLSAIAAAVIPLATWRWLWRPWESKRMAIEVAHYQPENDKTLPVRCALPNAAVLRAIGLGLGKEMKESETDEKYVARVFDVTETR